MAYYLSIKVYNRALSSGSIISLLETTEKTKKHAIFFVHRLPSSSSENTKMIRWLIGIFKK